MLTSLYRNVASMWLPGSKQIRQMTATQVYSLVLNGTVYVITESRAARHVNTAVHEALRPLRGSRAAVDSGSLGHVTERVTQYYEQYLAKFNTDVALCATGPSRNVMLAYIIDTPYELWSFTYSYGVVIVKLANWWDIIAPSIFDKLVAHAYQQF